MKCNLRGIQHSAILIEQVIILDYTTEKCVHLVMELNLAKYLLLAKSSILCGSFIRVFHNEQVSLC
jgi:hypothetical protein